MYICILIAILIFLSILIIYKHKKRKQQEQGTFDISQPKVKELQKNKPRKHSFLDVLSLTLILWIAGIGCLISGFCQIISTKEFIELNNKTTAVVTKVYEYEDYDGEGEYNDKRDVYLSYTANGQKYDSVIKEAEIYDSVGEQIEIYYSAKDPTVIVCLKQVKNKVSFLIPMGTVLCALAFTIHIFIWITPKTKKSYQ